MIYLKNKETNLPPPQRPIFYPSSVSFLHFRYYYSFSSRLANYAAFQSSIVRTQITDKNIILEKSHHDKKFKKK